jgi:hypothetical protein
MMVLAVSHGLKRRPYVSAWRTDNQRPPRQADRSEADDRLQYVCLRALHVVLRYRRSNENVIYNNTYT